MRTRRPPPAIRPTSPTKARSSQPRLPGAAWRDGIARPVPLLARRPGRRGGGRGAVRRRGVRVQVRSDGSSFPGICSSHPYPSFVELHQSRGRGTDVIRETDVVHPDGVQRVLGGHQALLGLEHLLGQGGGVPASVWAPGAGGASRSGLGVVHLRVPEFHHPLLDAVQFGDRPQLSDVAPDVVGDVVLERLRVRRCRW